jgi:integrase
MASLITEKRSGGVGYRVSFKGSDGKRRAIWLGSIPKQEARDFCSNVGKLAEAAAFGSRAAAHVLKWVDKLGADLRGKLAAVGLVAKTEASTLAAFIDGYIDSRHDAGPKTIRNFKRSREYLVAHFGADRRLVEINRGQAAQWRQSLANEDYAEATISKAVKHAKHFFRLAVDRELIAENPFAHLKGGSERNDERLRFIDGATIDKVIAKAPDAEWRLIIALARYGGLRTPSEALALRWSDVDFVNGRLTISSPKTGTREIPLFAELRPYLEEAFDPEATHVVRGRRHDSVNLRTRFMRIIERAGIEPWERLFHNLRASRQTELADRFPAHVVARWLGNSPTIAERHYLKDTEEHFRRAVESKAPEKSVARSVARRAGSEPRKNQRRVSREEAEASLRLVLMAIPANCWQSVGTAGNTPIIPPRGVEPLLPD